MLNFFFFFFSSRRRHTRFDCDWSSDVCSSDLMRPYQTEGFHFLAYLTANRFGGVLADDMGLGKTLQTLRWLSWLREQRSTGPAADHHSTNGGNGFQTRPSATDGPLAPVLLDGERAAGTSACPD